MTGQVQKQVERSVGEENARRGDRKGDRRSRIWKIVGNIECKTKSTGHHVKKESFGLDSL